MEKEASGTAEPWRFLWRIFLAAVFLLFLVGALCPEIFFDSLFYHLGFPNLYRLNHRLVNYPQLYSNFIEVVQMMYGFAITVGNTLVPKLLHSATGALLGFSLIAFGRRYLSPGAGLLSAVILLTTPLLIYNATTAGIDVAWTYFQFTACFALVRFFSNPSKRWLWLAGLLTGISAACKYPALPYIPLALLILWWQRRWSERQSRATVLREAMHFLLPALGVVSPFLIRSLAYHGNPLYPFAGTWWGHPAILRGDWAHFMSDAPARNLRAEFGSPSRALHFIFHPWFMTMEGDSLSYYVGPLFLIVLVPVCFMRFKNMPCAIFLRLAAGIWLLWLATTATPRYGLPALALLAPVAAQAVLSLRRWRALLLGLVAAGACLNLEASYTMLYSMGGWRVLGGQMSEADYLSDTRASYPTPPYEGYQWMNSHLPPEAKILIVGDSRSYYTDRRVIPASVYDPQALVEYARAPDAARMRQALRRDGVTHIFFNLVEAVRTQSYGLFPWDRAVWNTLNDFWAHDVRLIWKDERFERDNPKALYVFELLNDAQAAAPHAPPENPFERWKPR